jgi:hypothetical protein
LHADISGCVLSHPTVSLIAIICVVFKSKKSLDDLFKPRCELSNLRFSPDFVSRKVRQGSERHEETGHYWADTVSPATAEQ